MKELWIALALAWGVMAMVGCAGPRSIDKDPYALRGTQQGERYIQRADTNRVRNQATGEISYRRGNYLYNADGSGSKFISGGQVQESTASRQSR